MIILPWVFNSKICIWSSQVYFLFTWKKKRKKREVQSTTERYRIFNEQDTEDKLCERKGKSSRSRARKGKKKKKEKRRKKWIRTLTDALMLNGLASLEYNIVLLSSFISTRKGATNKCLPLPWWWWRADTYIEWYTRARHRRCRAKERERERQKKKKKRGKKVLYSFVHFIIIIMQTDT